jgi:hypothetical protein
MSRESKCSRRTIDLDQRTISVLKRRRVAQREEVFTVGLTAPADDRVFTNEIGDPLRPGSVGQLVRRLVAGCGSVHAWCREAGGHSLSSQHVNLARALLPSDNMIS